MSKHYSWLNHDPIPGQESLAKRRLLEIEADEPRLRDCYQVYLDRYNTYIKPVAAKAQQYVDEQFEKRKLEEFLQGKNIDKVVKLPYAGKSVVGHPAVTIKKPMTEDERRLDLVKRIDPATFERLLSEMKK